MSHPSLSAAATNPLGIPSLNLPRSPRPAKPSSASSSLFDPEEWSSSAPIGPPARRLHAVAPGRPRALSLGPSFSSFFLLHSQLSLCVPRRTPWLPRSSKTLLSRARVLQPRPHLGSVPCFASRAELLKSRVRRGHRAHRRRPRLPAGTEHRRRPWNSSAMDSVSPAPCVAYFAPGLTPSTLIRLLSSRQDLPSPARVLVARLRFLYNEQRHVRQAPASPVPARSRETSVSPALLTASLPVSLARAGLACLDPPLGPLSSRACGPTTSKASVPYQAASSKDLGQAHCENPPLQTSVRLGQQLQPVSRFFSSAV